ncbi:MAG TPA: response regulator [Planctomycetota bacterium]|jgi:signal transduction histidine kinase/CheY-like chemotaxis protein
MSRAIIVDDNAQNLYLLDAVLKANSYTVFQAQNGVEALEYARQFPPDVIISDILMPVMDGFSLCREWKADPVLRKIPFVFYTATYTDPQDEAFAISLGADSFIAKPIEPEDFMQAIRCALQTTQAGELQPARAPELEETGLLRQYNTVLIRKLEDKVAQLEEANCALLEQKNLIQGVMDSVGAHIAVLDSNGKLVSTNSAWSSFAREHNDSVQAHALQSNDYCEALGAAGTVGVQLATGIQEVLRGEKASVEAEFDCQTVKGRRWFLVRVSPLALQAGGAVLAYFDISEQKQAEILLQDAARHKDEFLAMLGHELRNPLAPICNAVHILKLLGSTDARVKHAREMIERQAHHLCKIVDDLLDVARLTRGKTMLHKERIDLAHIVRTTIEDFRDEIERRGLQLQANLPACPLWMEGDATRIAQVVTNLLHNAQKFTDKGSIKIDLKATADSKAGVLTVQDTGIGMTVETLARVFVPFVQANVDLARSRGGGVGLGTALVKQLVELHGGTVEVASEGLGRGSRFAIHVPLINGSSVGTPEATAGVAIGSKRVLVIEDNLDAAESLRMLLDMHGALVEIATDGISGLRKANEWKPDIVLCDIGLPGGMDGYAVARAIRSSRETHPIYLVAITGYGQNEDKRCAQDAGFNLHMTKPVDVSALMRVLATASTGGPHPFEKCENE